MVRVRLRSVAFPISTPTPILRRSAAADRSRFPKELVLTGRLASHSTVRLGLGRDCRVHAAAQRRDQARLVAIMKAATATATGFCSATDSQLSPLATERIDENTERKRPPATDHKRNCHSRQPGTHARQLTQDVGDESRGTR